jgi:hypothetical protein
MGMTIKVAIIENQQSHFDDISKYLCEYQDNDVTFHIIPNGGKYAEFTDLARIALDSRYDNVAKEKRRLALKRLVDFLNNNNPDILIVDHVLLGYTSTDSINPNGITLVEKMMKESSKLAKVPVLFLSSTLRNNAVVQEQLEKIEQQESSVKYKWENKNQFGQEGPFGGKDYFNRYIIPKVIELVNINKETSKWQDLFMRYDKTMDDVFIRAHPHRSLGDQEIKVESIKDTFQNTNSQTYEKYMELKSFLDEIETILNNEKPTDKRDRKIARIFNHFTAQE